MNEDIIGNITTIIKILIMTIAPTIAVYLGTSNETVIAFLTACLTFALAILDAKYPNTLKLFDNQKNQIDPSDILNPEYECDIDEY